MPIHLYVSIAFGIGSMEIVKILQKNNVLNGHGSSCMTQCVEFPPNELLTPISIGHFYVDVNSRGRAWISLLLPRSDALLASGIFHF